MHDCGDLLTLAQREQRPFGFLTPGLVEFWRIDTGEPNSRISNFDGVTVDHPTSAPHTVLLDSEADLFADFNALSDESAVRG